MTPELGDDLERAAEWIDEALQRAGYVRYYMGHPDRRVSNAVSAPAAGLCIQQQMLVQALLIARVDALEAELRELRAVAQVGASERKVEVRALRAA